MDRRARLHVAVAASVDERTVQRALKGRTKSVATRRAVVEALRKFNHNDEADLVERLHGVHREV